MFVLSRFFTTYKKKNVDFSLRLRSSRYRQTPNNHLRPRPRLCGV